MIRILIFGLVRLLFWGIVFYVASVLLRNFFRSLRVNRPSRKSTNEAAAPTPPAKPEVEYKDVIDAKFEDVADKSADNQPQQ